MSRRASQLGLVALVLLLGACRLPGTEVASQDDAAAPNGRGAVYHHEVIGLTIVFPTSWAIESTRDRGLPPAGSAMGLFSTYESGRLPDGEGELELQVFMEPGAACVPPTDARVHTGTRELAPAGVAAQDWRFRFADWAPGVWHRSLCVPWRDNTVNVQVIFHEGQEVEVEELLAGVRFESAPAADDHDAEAFVTDPEFRYAGEPIHPSALAAVWGQGPQPQPVDLRAHPWGGSGLTIDGRRVRHVTGDGTTTTYDVLAQVGERFIVRSAEYGGGSGVFTNVWSLEVREGQLIRELVLVGGDRCNGGLGLEEVSLRADGVLEATRWLNPATLLSLASPTTQAAASGHDLFSDAAQACIGRALVEVELDGGAQRLIEASLDVDAEVPRDTAFGHVFTRWIAAGRTSIGADEAEVLLAEVLRAGAAAQP